MARILVADDERSICEAFRALLTAEGHEVVVAFNGREALRLLRETRPDAAFLDVRMPGLDGIAVLKEIARENPSLPVIVMTAYGTLETAAEAMRNEAFDYLGKPLDLAQIRQVLARALYRPAPAADTTPVAPAAAPDARPALVGQSGVMQALFKLIVMLADNDLTVLVQGESGTGKELVARAIHESGRRAGEPFIAVNCAAIPEQLLESELFGHERGAFTDAKTARAGRFEAAGVGTLFLDEISDLPLHLQSKLLRVLQERSFERVGSTAPTAFAARLIAASNRDLSSEVAAGRFREDLYHRINIVTLQVPPLRDRRDDIPGLVQALVSRANQEVGKSITSVEQAVLDRLQVHDWPGNVRELEHVIKRSVLAAHGDLLSVHDLDFQPVGAVPGRDDPSPSQRALARLREAAARVAELADADGTGGDVHRRVIDAVESALIEAALRLTSGNQVRAARLLGINRSTLRSKLPPSESGD
jgi:DNA-binding NtrC family response regulator